MTSAVRLKPLLAVRKEQKLAFVSALSLTAAYVSYSVGHRHWLGLVLFGVTGILIAQLPAAARRYMAALLVAMVILSFVPFRTVPSLKFFFIVMGMMALSVAVVYAVSRFWEREHLIHFNFDWHRRWRHWEIAYILLTLATVYFLMPYYFSSTGAIHHWYFQRNIGEILAVFVCTMIVGIWEEFFFTATVLGVLRKYLPFFWANSLQAVMFAAFLYMVGFRYWAPFILFGYGWAQGWIFNKTKSLLFVLVVHVFVDLLVCFVLLHAYFPDLARMFVTG